MILPKLPDYFAPVTRSYGAPVTRSYGAPARTLSRTQRKPSERKVMLAADAAPIPIVYGTVRYAPLIGPVTVYGSTLILGAIWGMGEIDAVSEVYIDDAVATYTTATHYTGTTSQTADPTLAARITDYADTLVAALPGGNVGIAYSVLQIGTRASSGWPRIEGLVRGRKVYDPRTDTTVYSDNPALALADFLSDPGIGLDLTVDWSSVEDAADACDDTMPDSSKRRTAGILLDTVADVHQHVETLRTYAGCLVVPSGDSVRLVPNRPATTSRTLDVNDVMAGTLELSRRAQDDIPTVVEVTYTQTSTWDAAVAVASRSGVATGALPRRVSRVALPGVQTYAQAYREAVERLNAATLADLFATWITHDEGLKDQAGDVIELTHPIGLTSKKFRLLAVEPVEAGRYRVTAEEYDEAVYSDSVQTEPSYPDTDLPSPLDPVSPDAVTLVEELYQDETGTTYSRLRASWTGTDWPYAVSYRVVIEGAAVVLDATVAHRGEVEHQAVSAAITQGVSYEARVYTVSSVGTVSATPATTSVTAQGKLLLPTNVSTITGFEAGQFVALSWTPAIDIDLRGYHIKRVPEASWVGDGSDWDAAYAVEIVGRVDATSYLAPAQPVGSYRYGVVALDSIGQESEAPAWCAVTVTADVAGTGLTTVNEGTLTNAHAYAIDGVGRYVVSSEGDTWASRFGAAGTAWSTGATAGKLWAQEHSISGGVTIDTAHWDTGTDMAANWAWVGVLDSYGSASPVRNLLLATGDDYPTMTLVSGATANRSARYAAARVTEAASGADDVVVMHLPVTLSRQGKPMTQTGTESVTAGSQPVAVVFDPAYSEAPTITLTVNGSTPRITAADNITTTGFDLYVWDATGTAAAATVSWEAYGS